MFTSPQPPDPMLMVILSRFHDGVHDLAEALDPDIAPDTVTVEVNQPQAMFLALSTLLAGACYPCLKGTAIEITELFGRAVREQHPGEEGWDNSDTETPWGDDPRMEI